MSRRKLGTGGATSTTCTFVLSTEELASIDHAARLRGLTRSCFIRTMLRPLTVVKGASPAEAARDDSDGRDSPPSAPVATSRVASARRGKSSPFIPPRADAFRSKA